MAPGRRGRPSKEDVRRMNAAVEAMTKCGFESGSVRQKVKELMKEYDGDDGWFFIEDHSYTILINSLRKEHNVNSAPLLLKEAASQNGNGEPSTFNRSQKLPNALETDLIEEDQSIISPSIEAAMRSSNQQAQEKQMSFSSGQQRPSYGWLGSDADDYVLLPPMQVQQSTPRQRMVYEAKWDVKC